MRTTRFQCILAIQNSSSLRSKVNFTNTWFYLRGTGTVPGTKITKPLISHLHERGILCSIYIDDLYVQGSTFEECNSNVTYAVKIFESVGFDISLKSHLTPHQNIEHLGFFLRLKNHESILRGI